MGLFSSFLLIYLLGGLTFIPLVLSLFLLYSYLVLPPSSPQSEHASDSVDSSIRRHHDDQYSLKSGTDELAEEFYRTHDTDVAAGYFVVCREYVPGGVNGKPPERTTPAGAIVAAESPSVYQTMYKSLFDRKQALTIEPAKNTTKNGKRARNMFYIVLRHGHLMLYDDANQVEVRYVISLAHHNVSIYGGEGDIPESELWLKRNAISLSRRLESLADLGGPTQPFFFFSENLSEKEDFYFAMLQNQTKMGHSSDCPPKHQDFDVKHIVTLVQRLHSSEEQLQTRWINAVLGRIFLALYRTPEMEEFVRTKIIKKISRVNKPNFISKIGLRSIDMGNGAPFIINPRLKDLTVDGNCCVETDVQYTGNFRVEVSATVRIDLGQHFKTREVDIVLAVVLKQLDGHLLIRFKPPPSNRAWISFETMPNMVMDIEPIVSSKQITYGIILRTIESKIREMVAESLVLPFWDDVPFLDTLAQRFRGGIWQRETSELDSTVEIPDESGVRTQLPECAKEDTVKALKSKDDRTMSAPALSESATNSVGSHNKSGCSIKGFSTALPSPVGRTTGSPPRAIRSRTFSHTADPVLTADHGQMDGILSDFKNGEKSNATSAMIEISSRSPPATPNKTPNNSPPSDSHNLEAVYHSRGSSTTESIGSAGKASSDSLKRSSSAQTGATALNEKTTPSRSSSSLYGNKTRRSSVLESSTRSIAPSIASDTKSQSSLSLGMATSMAKKWGWSMFGRSEHNTDQESGVSRPAGTPEEPLGRGYPLPPPGTPLPTPAKVNKRHSVSVPKRKPVPATSLQDQDSLEENGRNSSQKSSLPRRKPVFGLDDGADQSDELLVIQAPYDSVPNSPADIAPALNLSKQGTAEFPQDSVKNDNEVKYRQTDAEEHHVTLDQSSTLKTW
ncbi:putative integral membrane protein conserved region-domain-containing protein [Aspergillus aurantiobrunneus]